MTNKKLIEKFQMDMKNKQLIMLKKRKLPKILSEEELKVFFSACEEYKCKTIFMKIWIRTKNIRGGSNKS